MKLRLPPDQVLLLHNALHRAGTLEIGGQIFGEQLGPSDFRAAELTFQRKSGTFARFIVDLVQAARDAVRFFDRTGHRYTRFNYIGEWHSHPRFEVRPSSTDVTSMLGLVGASDFQGNFAVLLIVRLIDQKLSAPAWVFGTAGRAENVTLEVE
jgi:[CysO sulfur-carrier protein]-S-L-cysteine hydrolase